MRGLGNELLRSVTQSTSHIYGIAAAKVACHDRYFLMGNRYNNLDIARFASAMSNKLPSRWVAADRFEQALSAVI